MNNVFVTNFRNQTAMFEATAKFRGDSGDIIPITEGTVNVFNTDSLTRQVRYELTEKGFRPEVDYILIAGNSIVAAVAMAVVKDMFHKQKINLLLYDNRIQDYMVRAV